MIHHIFLYFFFFFFQAEDGIRDKLVTGVQTCALPICSASRRPPRCRTPGSAAPPTAAVRTAGRSSPCAPPARFHRSTDTDAASPTARPARTVTRRPAPPVPWRRPRRPRPTPPPPAAAAARPGGGGGRTTGRPAGTALPRSG